MQGIYKSPLIQLIFLFLIGCNEVSSENGESHILTLWVEYNAHSYAATIDHNTKNILVNLPWEAPLEDLCIKATLSKGASYQFEEEGFYLLPQRLTVTARNGSNTIYTLTIRNRQQIELTDERIQIKGCRHVTRLKDELRMFRLSDRSRSDERLNYMNNGHTQSGVTIKFRTSSSRVRVKFKEIEGPHWGTDYGIWANGTFHSSVQSHTIELPNPTPSESVTWEIVPSLMNAVALTAIEIDSNSHLLDNSSNTATPVYFAIGNSITQGVGQGNASYKAYPFLLGKRLNYESVNLAVGGSKLSPIVAHELEGVRADLITILWGFNDWYYELISATDYTSKMQETIRIIRSQHPRTPLYCIGFIPTTNHTPAGQLPIGNFREALSTLVNELKEKGDSHIYYFDPSMLDIELMDGVHPSEKGATTLTNALYQEIIKNGLTQ